VEPVIGISVLGVAHSRRHLLPGEWTAAVIGAVLLPLVLNAAKLDVLMLPLLVVAAASVLRAGSGLLDRLALAAVLVAGALMVFGLLFSVWPWRLQPLAISWFLGLAIVFVGAISRRRPQLPRTIYLSDVIIVGTGVAAFAEAYRPLAHLSPIARYRYTFLTLDRITHFSLFATTQRLGGYPYLHPAAARASIRNSYETVYPQGSHFLLAVANGFLSNGHVTDGGTLDLNRYAVLVLAVYGALMAAIVWSIRWVAGPTASEPVRVLLCLAGTALALFGPLAGLIPFAADSQLLALVFVVVTGMLIIRPVSAPIEMLALIAALLVGTFSSYNLYGLVAVVGFALALLVHRFPLRQHWRAALLVVGPAAVVALMQSALTALGSFDVSAQATTAGVHIPLSNWLVAILAGAPLVPLVRSGDAVPRLRRGFLAVLMTAGITIIGFALYESISGRGNSYYLPKMVCAGYVLLLPAVGLFALATSRQRQQGQSAQQRQGTAGIHRVSRGAVTALAATALMCFGLAQQWLPGTESRGASAHFVPLARWADGRQRAALAPTFEALSKAGVIDGRTPTMVVASGNVTLNRGVTFAVSGLNNCLGRMDPVLNAMVVPAHSASGAAVEGQSVSSVLNAVRVGGGTMRIVVPSAAYASRLRAAASAEPGLHLTITVVAMGLPYVGTI
jgi:hypothetical protein